MTIAMVRAQELLFCFQNELQAPHSKPILPEHVMLRAGAQVTPLLSLSDDECCRGLGWVRIANISGVREINSTAPQDARCFGQERVLTLEIGAARCAPTPGASQIPGEDEWSAVAMLLDEDQGAMERAICCAFSELDDVAVGDYEPFGQDGNCIGGTMQVLVTMEACC
ncbi:MAG TPA: hypothetical protein VLG91_07725 [Streptomyces sp.]|nr:hypothetical protein [Streptomyces sp.]